MKKSYSEIVGGAKPTLVDFTASWCGPCKAMAPILNDLASDIGDAGRIIKIDVDKNRGLAEKLQIRGVPTFIVYKDGEILWRSSGMQTKDGLKNKMQL